MESAPSSCDFSLPSFKPGPPQLLTPQSVDGPRF
jgi:hypothetical protein